MEDAKNKLFLKYHDKDYFGFNPITVNKISEWERAKENGDRVVMKYTEKDIIKFMYDLEMKQFSIVFEKIKDAINKKKIQCLKDSVRYDQKLSLDTYLLITGVN